MFVLSNQTNINLKLGKMETNTNFQNIHHRINFKSHYPPSNEVLRAKRVEHYGHYAEKEGNYKSPFIPYWIELHRKTGIFISGSTFKSKF